MDLIDELALKVRDTLAGLVAAAANAEDEREKKFAQDALRLDLRWRVALHLEQDDKRSKTHFQIRSIW